MSFEETNSEEPKKTYNVKAHQLCRKTPQQLSRHMELNGVALSEAIMQGDFTEARRLHSWQRAYKKAWYCALSKTTLHRAQKEFILRPRKSDFFLRYNLL